MTDAELVELGSELFDRITDNPTDPPTAEGTARTMEQITYEVTVTLKDDYEGWAPEPYDLQSAVADKCRAIGVDVERVDVKRAQ